jgi:transcriptional regulator with XRE-family HTH domain
MEMWEIIRNYVQENGLIKNVLADKCGMDHQKFYRILSGNQNMTVEEYELICRNGLSVDPAYFFKQKFSKTENSKTA